MNLFNQIGIDIGYVVIGMAAFLLILFIMLIVVMVKHHNLKKKYQRFMDGKDGQNLEEAILKKFDSIENLEEAKNDIYQKITAINTQLNKTYQKIGMVKYDAFKEIGGKMSFVLVLLTAEDDGFILNSMHSNREGCYTYVKEVVAGEAYVLLSEEESQALEEAKENKSFIQNNKKDINKQ